MIKETRATKKYSWFLISLADKKMILTLHRKYHLKQILALKRGIEIVFLEDLARVLFSERIYTPPGVYSDIDYLKTLKIQIL